jgi:hypothetical protein
LHYYPCKIQVDQEVSVWDKSSGLCFQADSFWGHHLACPFTWPCSTWLLPMGLHPANIDDLKYWIMDCIQRITKEILQCVMTVFP